MLYPQKLSYSHFRQLVDSKLTEIQGEIDALEEEIMADMENWEALSQQLEELES